MSSYLITGANRGIGLELTKQLLESASTQVKTIFAVSRTDANPALNDLIKKHPDRLINIVATVTDASSVQKAVKDVESHLNSAGLDVLVNNAGVAPQGAKVMEEVHPDQMNEAFNVNVVGVQLVTQAFLPLLRKGKEKKVINVSSTLGSIEWMPHWHMPMSFAYRISKAGLNMMNRLYAEDFKDEGFTFLLLSPGWLKTDLGSQYADLEPEVGVKDVKRIILEANSSQNGKYYNIRVPGWENNPQGKRYAGEEIPF